MRLTELDPRWFTFAHPANGCHVALGLTFICPHCLTQRLGVHFDPPLDPLGQLAGCTPIVHAGPVWHRDGDTFETLTLTPSIDASGDEVQFKGHWHGFIKNGEVT